MESEKRIRDSRTIRMAGCVGAASFSTLLFGQAFVAAHPQVACIAGIVVAALIAVYRLITNRPVRLPDLGGGEGGPTRWPVIFLAVLLMAGSAMAADVTINGPNELDVKEADLLFVEGLSSEQFAECTVRVYPEQDKPQVLVLQTLNSVPVLYVKGRSAGKFAVILDVNVPGCYALVIHELVIGGDDEEDEDQDDDVNPPPPPVPPGELAVILVHESRDTTPDKSGPLRDYLSSREEIWWRIADQDQIDGATQQPPPWLVAANSAISQQRLKLPVIVVGRRSLDGVFSVVSVETFSTVEKAVALIEKGK